MKLKLVNFQNKGTVNQEVVVLQAVEDCQLGDYMIADITYNEDGTVSNIFRHAYWFCQQQLVKGDTVSLYTGMGQFNSTKSGSTTHYKFYWGSQRPIWNNSGDGVFLSFIKDRAVQKIA